MSPWRDGQREKDKDVMGGGGGKYYWNQRELKEELEKERSGRTRREGGRGWAAA